LDGSDNLFISDYSNDRVVELPGDGGSPIRLVGGLDHVIGLAADGNGNIFVSTVDPVVELQRATANFGKVNLCSAGQTSPESCNKHSRLSFVSEDKFIPQKDVVASHL
jgi:hypothetical protein